MHQVIILVKYDVFDIATDIAYAAISETCFTLGDRNAGNALTLPLHLALLIKFE